MIEARGLTRRYGEHLAVRDVSFQVDDGEILGLLGPNGAGKTTILRMLTGFLPPTGGEVTIADHDLASDPLAARRELGYLPENVALYPEMRVDEYLAFRARLAGLERSEIGDAIDRAVGAALLGEVRHQIIGTLSKGYRQRVGLASAILHGPRVLILDEPTVGLDPKQIIAIRELIRDLGRERTLILSTHILPEVEQLCQRVLIIDRGRVIAEGTPAELQGRAETTPEVVVTLSTEETEAESAPLTAAPGALEALEGVRDVVADDVVAGRFHLRHDPDADPRREIFRLAVEKGWTLLEMQQRRASLEELFVRLTASQGGASENGGEGNPAPESDLPETDLPEEGPGKILDPETPSPSDTGSEAGSENDEQENEEEKR